MTPRFHWLLVLVILCGLVAGVPASAGAPPAPGDPPVEPQAGAQEEAAPEPPLKPGVPEGSVSMGGPNQAFLNLVAQSGGIASAVTKRDNNLFAGIGPRMFVLDVTNPAAPSVVGRSVVLTATVRWIHSEPGIAYVLDSKQLRIFDVSSPSLPTLLSSTPMVGDCYSGVYSPTATNKWIYVAAGAVGGVRALDVTNPLAVVQHDYYDSPGQAYGLARAGSYLYLADGTSGLRVLSVTDPTNILPVGSVAAGGYESFLSVAVYGDVAYVGTSLGRFLAFNVSDPAHPAQRGSVTLSTGAYVWSVYVVGGAKAYAAAERAGLFALNITDPDNPTIDGYADTPGRSRGVLVSNSVAYLADFYGVRTFDVSNPTPVQVGVYPALGDSRAVSVLGDYAYIADSDFGMRVVSMVNIAAPEVVGSWNAVTTTRDVFADGNYVYVAAGANGLQVIDVSAPTAPVRCGYYTPGLITAIGVWKSGDYAYLADSRGYLHVIDVTPCESTAVVGVTPSDALTYTQAVAVSGNYAYVAAGSDGLAVLDVATPSAPSVVGTLLLPDENDATAVAILGSWVFVASSDGYLYKIDVSTPSNPVLSAETQTPGSPLDVSVIGNYAYVADAGSGAHLYAATSANLDDGGYFDTAGQASGITTRVGGGGVHAFVADGVGGLYILGATGDVLSGKVLFPVALRNAP